MPVMLFGSSNFLTIIRELLNLVVEILVRLFEILFEVFLF